MNRFTKNIGLSTIGLLALAAFFPCERWQGRFLDAKFEFTFINGIGEPIANVRLEVVDKNNREAFFYPVSDFTSERAVFSDVHGKLVFHHVGSGGPEFGGACYRPFFVLRSGKCEPDDYTCRFIYSEKCVFAVSYRELDAAVSKLLDKNDDRDISTIVFQWPRGFPEHLKRVEWDTGREAHVTHFRKTVHLRNAPR
jgi:hypothetical protein